MTTVDHVGGGALPPEEVAMLFGFGKRRGEAIGTEFAKSWKYQAPFPPSKLAHKSPTVERKSPNLPLFGSDGMPWQVEQVPEEIPTEKHSELNDMLHVPEEPVEDYQAQFNQLLISLDCSKRLLESEITPLTNVLRKMSAELAARNLVSLIETLSSYDVAPMAWRKLAFIVHHKVKYKTFTPEQLASVLKSMLQITKNWNKVASIFAKALAHSRSQDALLDVLDYTIQFKEFKVKTAPWLPKLRAHHPVIREGHFNTPSWMRLYGVLAKHFTPSSNVVAEHFGTLKRHEFAQILLEFYQAAWAMEAERKAQTRRSLNEASIRESADPMTVEDQMAKTLGLTDDAASVDDFGTDDLLASCGTYQPYSARIASITADGVESLQAKLETARAQWKTAVTSIMTSDESANYAIGDLVEILARCQLPYARLFDEVFAVYMQTQNHSMTKNLFLNIRNRQGCAVPIATAGKLVHHFIASGDIDFAFYVYRSVPSLPLLPYAELLLELIEGGRTHGEKIFEMLNRYHPQERIHYLFRKHYKLAIKQEHVDLVHKVAYAFAESSHLRPRTAFRRVWECYRYLCDRRAPLEPTLSRALVKAGISRPLRESNRLSEAQVKYVISIVDKIEGADVAKEVDRITWDAWQRCLESQWFAAQPPLAKGPNDQGPWNENKRRLWMKGGGRVYSPEQDSIRGNDEHGMTHSGNDNPDRCTLTDATSSQEGIKASAPAFVAEDIPSSIIDIDFSEPLPHMVIAVPSETNGPVKTGSSSVELERDLKWDLEFLAQSEVPHTKPESTESATLTYTPPFINPNEKDIFHDEVDSAM